MSTIICEHKLKVKTEKWSKKSFLLILLSFEASSLTVSSHFRDLHYHWPFSTSFSFLFFLKNRSKSLNSVRYRAKKEKELAARWVMKARESELRNCVGVLHRHSHFYYFGFGYLHVSGQNRLGPESSEFSKINLPRKKITYKITNLLINNFYL